MDAKEYIIKWNSKYKYDRLWRKKYNIPFGSEAHKSISQVEIYLDLLEDRLFDKAQLTHLERIKDLEEYQRTGKFLREEVVSQEAENALFKKAKFKKQ